MKRQEDEANMSIKEGQSSVGITTKLQLVKYADPIVKSVKNRFGVFVGQQAPERTTISFADSELALQKRQCEKVRKNVDQDSLFNEMEMKNILDNLYPPIEWKDDGHVYQKSISLQRSTKEEILELVSQLEQFVQDPNVSLKGVSDYTAQNVWTQAFDECIRQILLEKPLHGILFRRIRDLTLNDLESRKKLYLSAAAFGARKDIQLSNQIIEMKEQLDKNAEIKQDLLKQLHGLREEQKHAKDKFSQHFAHDQQEYLLEATPLFNDKRRLINELKHRTERTFEQN